MTDIYETLTKKIEELSKELEKAGQYREAFFDINRKCSELTRQLERKRKVVCVSGYKNEDLKCEYRLLILDVIDTPEGIFIKVLL